MADFMTPEEIQAQAQQLYDQYDKGYISAKQLQEGLNDCNKGVRGFTQELKASLNQLGTSIKGLGEDLKNGKQGASTFNNALNSGADAAAKAAMQFGPLGVAVGAVIKVLTFFVTAANEQADALYKANQDLSKVGATGAAGMSEIYSNLKEFGYGVGELGDMGALITQNAVALSNFNGTVAQGAKAMASVSKGIHDSDLQRQFMNMGYSINDINKGVGSYITQQAYFGTSQKKTTEELKQGAADYLANMSRLSKLTGQSADDMAKQREEALAIDAFNAALEGMSEADKERQLERYNYLSKIDKDAAVGYANQVSGFVGLGKQSQQLFMTTGGISNRLAKDSKLTLSQFGQSLADATQSTHGLRKSQALLGNTDTFLAYGKTQKLANQAGGQVLKAMQDAADATNAQADGADDLTNAATKTRQAQMGARDSFEDLIQSGIKPVTEAMEGLATIINTIVHPFGGGRGPNVVKSAKETFSSAVNAGEGDADKILATIRKRESGGNYAAQAKGSSASGAYQFIDSTWQSLSKKYGIGTEFKSAKNAPKATQDAVAKAYVDDLLKQAKGDVSKIPLAWYTGNIQGKISPQALAANNGLTPEKYQSGWMKDYANISGPTNGRVGTGVSSAQTGMPAAPATDPTVKTANNATTQTDLQERQLAELRRSNDIASQQLRVQKQSMS